MQGALPAEEVARISALRRPVQDVVLGVWAPLLELSRDELDALVAVAGGRRAACRTSPCTAIDPGPGLRRLARAASSPPPPSRCGTATGTTRTSCEPGAVPRPAARLRVHAGVIALGLLPPYRLDVASDPAWMAAFARHADEVGFESLLAVEHVAVPVGYESRYPYSDTGRMPLPEDCELPDPLDLLAWLAARTERLRLGTGILVLPEHHPLQLAKRCATIDRLSGGRLFLGVGVGWMREEVAALGIDPDERGSRTDEGIDALRVDLATRRSRPSPASTSRSVRCAATPSRSRRRIPILVGGHSPAAARRAGRLGDGFFPLGPVRRAPRPAAGPRCRPPPTDAGRDPAAVSLTLGGLLGDDAAITDAVDARRRARRPRTRTADLDELRHAMDAAVAQAADPGRRPQPVVAIRARSDGDAVSVPQAGGDGVRRSCELHACVAIRGRRGPTVSGTGRRLAGSGGHEDRRRGGRGPCRALDAGEALVQHDPRQDDGAHGVEGGEDGDDAEQALAHGEEVEDVGERRRGRRRRR